MSDEYKFGIEEEYFLVDAETKSVAREMPASFLDKVKSMTGGQVSGEMLQSQIEVMTIPHSNIGDARTELRFLRQTVSNIAAEHGLAILAVGTHPTAQWNKAVQTQAERYDNVMEDLQMIGQRNMLCGLHVHVELPDPDDRVDIMMRMLPYLPLFIALATSSPFWRARPTGLKGYRLAAYDELPRTGVPELFRTPAEYEAYVSRASECRRDGEFELRVVGDPPLAEASDAGAACAGQLHADRGFDCDRGALSHARAAPHAQSLAKLGPHRGDAGDRGREQVARAALWRERHASSTFPAMARSRSPTCWSRRSRTSPRMRTRSAA